MPGSGKTTLGQPLADKLGLTFVDQDREIENREGKSVPEIFSSKGEEYFRQVESIVLHEWAGSEKSFVMATGGGTPCFFQGMVAINKAGLSIFLDVTVQELIQRLATNKDRPLLNVSDVAEKEQRLLFLRANRLKYYNQAHIILSNPDECKLLEAVQLKR